MKINSFSLLRIIQSYTKYCGVCILIILSLNAKAQQPEPWKEKDLMPPEELAQLLIHSPEQAPLILSIGPGGGIKNSVEFGAVSNTNNLEKFSGYISKLPKNTYLVIYCGCCPFEHCPNIRPAFNELMKQHFSNAKLLNLSHNLKVDWIDKNYPLNY